ncbi:hypothetical protein [Helicobacter trogontum]|uniref:Uncharacterized protein n=1 Tax=Helicobacter trogontum TaxID=50960 RepID=A0A4U8T010_9HELI|nr:hypothetical protein [Helicobacter trogontum]MCI5786962.1 hypothetical protein [Helicobacter trogontum]MDY5184665.1 hypothetical protein [Helicobacter trogontum]TLD92689.1 hypothetical protein LS80_010930 [Helicobacter trogontum]
MESFGVMLGFIALIAIILLILWILDKGYGFSSTLQDENLSPWQKILVILIAIPFYIIANSITLGVLLVILCIFAFILFVIAKISYKTYIKVLNKCAGVIFIAGFLLVIKLAGAVL